MNPNKASGKQLTVWPLEVWKSEVEKVRKRNGHSGKLPQDVEKKWKVDVRYQGNFTTAVLLANREVIGVGVAKRKPDDKDSDKIGEPIAITRALRDYLARTKRNK